MNKEQNRESPQSEIMNIAIAFAYDNIPDLKKHGVLVDAQDCSARRVVHPQQIVGPGEAIDTILPDEEWEVSIPLRVFSSRLIITVHRYNDGSLGVTDCQSLPFR